MQWAINVYTGNWTLVETLAVFKHRADAYAALTTWNPAASRQGMTIVVEEINAKW